MSLYEAITQYTHGTTIPGLIEDPISSLNLEFVLFPCHVCVTKGDPRDVLSTPFLVQGKILVQQTLEVLLYEVCGDNVNIETVTAQWGQPTELPLG